MKKFSVYLLILSLFSLSYAKEAAPFENESDYPLMGNWSGQWINPTRGHEKNFPQMAIQILPMGGLNHKVVILPALNKRAKPYATLNGKWTNDQIVVKTDKWDMVFSNGKKTFGKGFLHGQVCHFEVQQLAWSPKTLGRKPPQTATILFDGKSTTEWVHQNSQPCSWNIVDGVLETVSSFWFPNVPEKDRLGGTINTKKKFGSMTFHMEFRYPVEEKKRGQGRGNSSLFFYGIGGLQILNSYTTEGYWDETGAFYKEHPAKVNAAGPPLKWQTYDIEIDFLENKKVEVTVELNGINIHNKLILDCAFDKVGIGLEDHINRLQFRNIWVMEK